MNVKAYFWANFNSGLILNTQLSGCEVIGRGGARYELVYRTALITPGAVQKIRLWFPRRNPEWTVLLYVVSNAPGARYPEAFLTLVEPKRSGRPNKVLKYRLQDVAFLAVRRGHGLLIGPSADMIFAKAEETCVAH